MGIGALIVASSAALAALQGGVSTPVRTAGPGYDGVIISAEAQLERDRAHGATAAEFWTPNATDVQETEKLLSAYLDTPGALAVLRGTPIRAQLSRYKRQYRGIVRDGQRVIWVFFCHDTTPVVQEGHWLHGMIAAGGGAWYFQVTYDVHAKRFTGLNVNEPE